MNLKDFYTHDQVCRIFNFKYRQQIKRFREKYDIFPIKVGKCYYYDRKVIDALSYQKFGVFEHEKRKIEDPFLVTMDLNLDTWKTSGEIVEMFDIEDVQIWGIYEINKQFVAPQIRTIEYNNTIFFNVEDVRDWLK